MIGVVVAATCRLAADSAQRKSVILSFSLEKEVGPL
jgi:hypothetical protein